MNVTFIVGNGLDVNLGLETRYTDFYSYIKKKKPTSKNQIYTAIGDDPETWAQFELALGAHTQQIESFDTKDREKASKDLHEAFDEVLSDLGDYLEDQESQHASEINPYYMNVSDFYVGLLGESSRKITGILGGDQIAASFITLNYTSTLEKMLYPARQTIQRRGINLRQIHHAHGKLSEYIAVGVSNESQISAALEGDSRDDLIKPRLLESMGDDRLATTTNIIKDSNILVLFGTSFGETDQYIWELVVSWLILDENRYIVLHDYNRGFKERPTRNPSRIKQLDNEARNRLLDHLMDLEDEEKVELRSRILVVRNTSKLFNP